MAGNVYNPNSPNVIGQQWFADLYGQAALGAWAQRIRSRSAETINRLDAYLTPGSGTEPSLILAEIIPADSEIPGGTLATASYLPNADVSRTVGPYWATETSAIINLWDSINEDPDSSPDETNYVANLLGSTGNYVFHVASNAFSSTARVLNLGIRIRHRSVFTSGSSTIQVGIRDIATTTDYYPNGSLVTTGSGFANYTFDLGEINPKTKLPWTFTDVRGFDTIGNTWGIIFNSPNSAGNIVCAAELVVTYQTVENRVAGATWLRDTPLWQWHQWQQFCGLPSGGATWAKPASGDFTILFRLPLYAFLGSTPAAHSLGWIQDIRSSGARDCIVPGVMSAIPVIDSYGRVASLSFSSTTTRGRTIGVALSSAGPTVSQDSLPYVFGLLGFTFNPHPFPDINASQSIQQLFTAPQSATYSFVKILVQPNSATLPLLAKIKRVSDNVQFGSTMTYTPQDVNAEPEDGWSGFRVVTRNLSPGAALVNGTQYYLELSTTDTTSGGSLGWQAAAWGAPTGPGTGAGAASFGGTTDFIKIGATSYSYLDMPFVVGVPPAAPVGLTVASTSQPNNVDAQVQNCVPTAIRAVQVSWTATALGANFGYYEVARKVASDPDTEYQTIAHIATEASTSFLDYEVARNIGHQYRIRVIRADDVASLWSASSAGVTCVSLGSEVIFTSNEAQSMSCAFDYDPTTDIEFISASRDELVPIYGSNYQVAFMECEETGQKFDRTLVVHFGTRATVPAVSIFQPIRDISRAGTAYVCVLDYVGNKWLAHVQANVGHWTEPGSVFKADVTVTEVSTTPSVVIG